jgi:hypothetical protein
MTKRRATGCSALSSPSCSRNIAVTKVWNVPLMGWSGSAPAPPAISWPGAPSQGTRNVRNSSTECDRLSWYRYWEELIPHRSPRRSGCDRVASRSRDGSPQFSSHAGNWALTSAARWCSRSLSCLYCCVTIKRSIEKCGARCSSSWVAPLAAAASPSCA